MTAGGGADAKAAKAAGESVRLATALQGITKRETEAKTADYRKETDKEIRNLANITGQPLSNYISSTGANWNQYVASERPRLTQSIQAFDPGILNSASAQRATEAYRQMLTGYETGVRGLTSDITTNLRQAAQEAPEQVFSRLAGNPAFNLQYDRRAMRLAANPPTRRSNVDVREFSTYNV